MSLVEWVAVIFSFLSVIWSITQNKWCWWVDILGNTAYLILFIQQKLYCEAVLQIIFNIQCVYGLYQWKNKKTDLPVTYLGSAQFTRELFFLILFTLSGYLLLIQYGNDSQPLLDIVTTMISLLANQYLTKKRIQSWYLWIFVDVLFVGMFSIQHLYLSVGLYVLFLCLAVKGLYTWKKDLKLIVI